MRAFVIRSIALVATALALPGANAATPSPPCSSVAAAAVVSRKGYDKYKELATARAGAAGGITGGVVATTPASQAPIHPREAGSGHATGRAAVAIGPRQDPAPPPPTVACAPATR